jgi:hypothetical protein
MDAAKAAKRSKSGRRPARLLVKSVGPLKTAANIIARFPPNKTAGNGSITIRRERMNNEERD